MVPGIVYSWSWTIPLDELEMYQFFATLSIINATSYISFNVRNQAIIHPLNVEQIIEQNLILLA